MTQPPAGSPYAYQPHPQTRRKGLLPLVFGGLTLLLGVPLVFILPLLLGVGGFFTALLNPIEPGGARELPADSEHVLVATSTAGEELSADSCTVTSPDGEAATLDPVLSTGPNAPEVLWRMDAEQAGEYTFDCGQDTTVALMGSGAADNAITAILWALGLALLALVIGLGLVIWGVIQLVRTNRARSEREGGLGGPPGPGGSMGTPTSSDVPVGGAAYPVAGGEGDQASSRGSRFTRGHHEHSAADGSTDTAAVPDPAVPHPHNGVIGRPAPMYGQYAPGHEPVEEPSSGVEYDADPEPPKGSGPARAAGEEPPGGAAGATRLD